MIDGNNPIKVLFVDDEENILKSLRRLLMDEEYEILTADSGAAGLELLQQDKGENVGLIVSDQRMPGMSGVEFLQLARQINPDALRIILTGFADATAAVDAINEGGAYRYISKPWNDNELTETIREAVLHYRLLIENRHLNEIIKQKNIELKEWNDRLKSRVLQQTSQLREKCEELRVQNSRIRKNFKDLIAILSGLIELRGKALRNHSKNVAALATIIAKGLELPPSDIETIHIASLLHDIGEIGIPDHLSGQDHSLLQGEDLKIYMRHVVRGQTAIDLIEELRPAGELIRHHHECFDGSGYPDGLQGETIPLGSRVIAAADYLDRLMDKLLKQTASPLAVEAALKQAREVGGKQLDPKLIPLLGRALKQVYGKILSESGMVKIECAPTELRPGMILVNDLYTMTGLLLLSKGSLLNEPAIKTIIRHNELDPFQKKSRFFQERGRP